MTRTVNQLVEAGTYVLLELVRFDLPGKTVGYHRGGRPYTYNGVTYLPNRYLQAGAGTGALGVEVTSRTLVFSGVPTADPDDAIAQIENYSYLNAPVIFSYLAGDPETDEAAGVLFSHLYEIDRVWYGKAELDQAAVRRLTVNIELQPPGRSARGATLAKVSPAEHKFDNDATDTCLEHAAVNATIQEEWGRQ